MKKSKFKEVKWFSYINTVSDRKRLDGSQVSLTLRQNSIMPSWWLPLMVTSSWAMSLVFPNDLSLMLFFFPFSYTPPNLNGRTDNSICLCLSLCCCWVAKSCLTLCDPVDCSTPGFLVLHYLPEFAQTPVHWVSDAIQPSYVLSPPSTPPLSLFQHQGFFQWERSSHQVAKVVELQHQSF